MHSHLITGALFLVGGFTQLAGQTHGYPHPGSFYLESQFTPGAKSEALQRIVTLATELKTTTASAPANFEIPAYAQNPAEQQRRVKDFQRQVRAAYVSAVAYRITEQTPYAEMAKRVILAWTRGNLRIAGEDGPVVMNYLGPGLLIAADLVWESFSTDELAAVQDWTRAVYLRQAVVPENRKHRNNHRAWAIFSGLLAAFVLEDPDLFASYGAQLDQHIHASILPDGKQPLELARGERAGWYSYFALAPILAGVQVVQNVTGEQLWDRHDRRLEHALEYLHANYANPDRLGAGTWMNPENLFEAVAGVYPKRAWTDERYMRPARPVDASDDQHVAWEFPTAFKARRSDATKKETTVPTRKSSS